MNKGIHCITTSVFLLWIISVCGLSCPVTLKSARPHKYCLLARVLHTVESLLPFEHHVFLIFFRIWRGKCSKGLTCLKRTTFYVCNNSSQLSQSGLSVIIISILGERCPFSEEIARLKGWEYIA